LRTRIDAFHRNGKFAKARVIDVKDVKDIDEMT
jgi:hypothetical protein